MKSKPKPFILWFNEMGIEDIALVGGKNASLGEMYRHLEASGVQVPNGFAITTEGYFHTLESSGALKLLKKLLHGLNTKDVKALQRAGKKAREIILNSAIPPDLEQAIIEAYRKLSSSYRSKGIDVAVRSSATAEDLPEASFAGQQETYLNITGTKALLKACKDCFASLYTDRAIAYRAEHHIDHMKIGLSIGIQKMVRTDKASSGVMFTLDTESGFRDIVLITGSYGLGESIVQGAVIPDEFYVFKPTLKKGFRPIIYKNLGSKASKIVYSKSHSHPTKTVATPKKEREGFCLNEDEVLQLAKWALLVEEHYSKKRGHWTPMDLEWAKDGRTQQLYILQARPETVQSRKKISLIEEYRLQQKGTVVVAGKSVGAKIGQGKAHVIKDIKDSAQFKKGEVLVTDMTDPDWVPLMRIASAIVTNRGGRTSHAAIVSRELGLPCIVGTKNATQAIKKGQKITVCCAEGERGVVYDGLLKFKVETHDIERIPKPKTKVMVNIGEPQEAFELSFLPNEGVGLAREEFIISEFIKVHPMALLHFDQVKDAATRKKIQALTQGYKDKGQFFIDKLAMGIAIIAAAFYPKDVIMRFSDFKTNEYVNLIGGKYFEPKEENPMIGWRGASRYYKPGYEEGFALECKAVKKVLEEFGLTNLKVMIPVCRTVEEGNNVLQVMHTHGLQRKESGLEVYVMCEIPSNVVLAEEFCKIFDGFSIGSNDLTQMMLGVDRDNELVSDIFNERNAAVTRMIKHVIQIAKKNKRKIGICGDAPSTYPEFAKFLVDCGIDSISLSPDALLSTIAVIAKYEQRKKSKDKGCD